ncbi:MAG: magnesium transporter, partial [Dehalococcoidia bacterium]|nr:magnesium transporter [Dehalococcoidia bacterium]
MGIAESSSNRRVPPADASADTVEAFIESAHPIDLAAWLEELSQEEAWDHLAALDLPRRAKVFEYLPLTLQLRLARGM